MEPTRRSAVLGASAALTLGACARDDTGSPPRKGVPARTVAIRSLRVAQTPAERRRTRASVRRLDDHPLYAVEWQGAAAALDPRPPPSSPPTSERSPFGCTLFVARGPSGDPLVGRNFDWDPGPAAVVRSRVRRGLRSLSVTDLSFIGYSPDQVGRLDDPDGRAGIGRVQAAVVDGMNEHGVFIGLAADDSAAPPADRGRPRLSGLGVQRMVLDHARSVDDAVRIINRYDLTFTGGPPLHYLLADATGASAVIEFDRGRLTRIPPVKGDRWQVLENFHMASVPVGQRDSFRRYSTCARTLTRTNGSLSEAGARRLMKAVKQSHTQWTGIYDLSKGTLAVFTGGEDRTLHRFTI